MWELNLAWSWLTKSRPLVHNKKSLNMVIIIIIIEGLSLLQSMIGSSINVLSPHYYSCLLMMVMIWHSGYINVYNIFIIY